MTQFVECESRKEVFDFLSEINRSDLLIVTDINVCVLYNDILSSFMDRLFIMPASERSKNLSVIDNLYDKMNNLALKKTAVVVAFGGGVVGDVAGFAASTYMRGLRLIMIPTTVLAIADSSVGGKTAIDYKRVKDLIGTYYIPEKTLVFRGFIDTLSRAEKRAGLGDIIKTSLLKEDIYKLVVNNQKDGGLYENSFLALAALMCRDFKAEITDKDPDDLGKRRLLSIGSTTAHAIESVTPRISHGDALLAGLKVELGISSALGLLPKERLNEIFALINELEVPHIGAKKKSLLLAARRDYKNLTLGISFIALNEIGDARPITVENAIYFSGLEKYLD